MRGTQRPVETNTGGTRSPHGVDRVDGGQAAFEQRVEQLIKANIGPPTAHALAADTGFDFVIAGEQFMVFKIKQYDVKTAEKVRNFLDTGGSVVLDLWTVGDAVAVRLVDFAAGLSFGRHARMRRIDARVFAIARQQANDPTPVSRLHVDPQREAWHQYWEHAELIGQAG